MTSIQIESFNLNQCKYYIIRNQINKEDINPWKLFNNFLGTKDHVFFWLATLSLAYQKSGSPHFFGTNRFLMKHFTVLPHKFVINSKWFQQFFLIDE